MDSATNGDDLPLDDKPVTLEMGYDGCPPSVAVVAAIAALEDTPPSEVDFSLYEHVDPEAIDQLFTRAKNDDEESDAEIVAEFSIMEYKVQIRNDGTVTVTPHDESE